MDSPIIVHCILLLSSLHSMKIGAISQVQQLRILSVLINLITFYY